MFFSNILVKTQCAMSNFSCFKNLNCLKTIDSDWVYESNTTDNQKTAIRIIDHVRIYAGKTDASVSPSVFSSSYLDRNSNPVVYRNKAPPPSYRRPCSLYVDSPATSNSSVDEPDGRHKRSEGTPSPIHDGPTFPPCYRLRCQVLDSERPKRVRGGATDDSSGDKRVSVAGAAAQERCEQQQQQRRCPTSSSSSSSSSSSKLANNGHVHVMTNGTAASKLAGAGRNNSDSGPQLEELIRRQLHLNCNYVLRYRGGALPWLDPPGAAVVSNVSLGDGASQRREFIERRHEFLNQSFCSVRELRRETRGRGKQQNMANSAKDVFSNSKKLDEIMCTPCATAKISTGSHVRRALSRTTTPIASSGLHHAAIRRTTSPQSSSTNALTGQNRSLLNLQHGVKHSKERLVLTLSDGPANDKRIEYSATGIIKRPDVSCLAASMPSEINRRGHRFSSKAAASSMSTVVTCESKEKGSSRASSDTLSQQRIQTNDVPAGGQSGSVNNLSCNKAVGKKKNKEELQYDCLEPSVVRPMTDRKHEGKAAVVAAILSRDQFFKNAFTQVSQVNNGHGREPSGALRTVHTVVKEEPHKAEASNDAQEKSDEEQSPKSNCARAGGASLEKKSVSRGAEFDWSTCLSASPKSSSPTTQGGKQLRRQDHRIIWGSTSPVTSDDGEVSTVELARLEDDDEGAGSKHNFAASILETKSSTHNVWSRSVMKPRRISDWSFKSDQQEVEDLYCDDDLNGDDPNLQLQIVRESTHHHPEGGCGAGSIRTPRYPPNPMLVDQESILSMDIASTGPTSLRSNFTDETEEDDEDDSEDNKEDRFAKLTAPEELSQATLIRTGLSYT